MKKLRITVDGKVFEVTVETLDDSPAATQRPQRVTLGAAAAPPPSAAPAAAAHHSAAAGDVPSPLAGRVVALNCQVGDKVEAGAQLVTIEAMKMNTFVNAPAAGTVTKIFVKPGDAVEEGQPLVHIQS